MRKLSVNIDHIATLRQSRRTSYPEVVFAAGICELAGADGITFHLREDRRHIQDRDVRLLNETINTKLNFEMAATKDMSAFAKEIRPYMVTLVPEKREELTTEGGLDVVGQTEKLKSFCDSIKKEGILLCLFVDPDFKQINSSKDVGCDYIEVHTGTYCDAKTAQSQNEELTKIKKACRHAKELGLKVNAGHGIYYNNVSELAQIPEIEEFSIGHGIISKAVFVGLEQAVREMKQLIQGEF